MINEQTAAYGGLLNHGGTCTASSHRSYAPVAPVEAIDHERHVSSAILDLASVRQVGSKLHFDDTVPVLPFAINPNRAPINNCLGRGGLARLYEFILQLNHRIAYHLAATNLRLLLLLRRQHNDLAGHGWHLELQLGGCD